ncbi:hypothetical protein QMY54_01577 [Pseudomonas rhodesiae]|jgi:hypothetical protein|nr:hypothetical protein QMY54_01577 [Pseudomonas rhodesiae]
MHVQYMTERQVFNTSAMGGLAWSLSSACASSNVDVEVLQVAYQPQLQTFGKGLLRSVRFRYLIP